VWRKSLASSAVWLVLPPRRNIVLAAHFAAFVMCLSLLRCRGLSGARKLRPPSTPAYLTLHLGSAAHLARLTSRMTQQARYSLGRDNGAFKIWALQTSHLLF
jgi:hypothetical protein